jgi:hypothetical protein
MVPRIGIRGRMRCAFMNYAGAIWRRGSESNEVSVLTVRKLRVFNTPQTAKTHQTQTSSTKLAQMHHSWCTWVGNPTHASTSTNQHQAKSVPIRLRNDD